MPIKLIHRCKLLPNKRWKAAFVLLFEQGDRRVAMLGEDGDHGRTFKTEKRAKRRNLELAAVFCPQEILEEEDDERDGDGVGA